MHEDSEGRRREIPLLFQRVGTHGIFEREQIREHPREAHHPDVSTAYQPLLDEAMCQLSRPGLQLKCHVRPPEFNGPTKAFFDVHIDLALNGLPAWRWTLTRKFLNVVPRFAEALCALDDQAQNYFVTSAHSEIEDARGELWPWLQPQ